MQVLQKARKGCFLLAAVCVTFSSLVWMLAVHGRFILVYQDTWA